MADTDPRIHDVWKGALLTLAASYWLVASS